MSSIDTITDRCALVHAREACTEALADLAATELSLTGTAKQRPEYWVGQLQYLLGHLLVVLDQNGILTRW